MTTRTGSAWRRSRSRRSASAGVRREAAGHEDEPPIRELLDERNAAIIDAVNRTGEVFLSHTRLGGRFTIRLSVSSLRTEQRHVDRAWELLRREAARLQGAAGGRRTPIGRIAHGVADPDTWGPASAPASLRARLEDASRARLAEVEFGDGFQPAAAAAVVAAGLHLAPVPVAAGGLGIGASDAVELLAALGAIDGSLALGFAMHMHVVAGMAQAAGVAGGARGRGLCADP